MISSSLRSMAPTPLSKILAQTSRLRGVSGMLPRGTRATVEGERWISRSVETESIGPEEPAVVAAKEVAVD